MLAVACQKSLRYASYRWLRSERMPFIPRLKSLGLSGMLCKVMSGHEI